MRRATRRTTFLLLLSLSALLVPGARAQEAATHTWYALRSPHFEIYTDATPQRAAEIALHLELFREVFARLAPSIDLRSPAPTRILAFRDARSYAPYKTAPDRGRSRILGQFLSRPCGNYLTLDAGTELVGSFAVIFHEFVHYLVRHNFPGAPLWFHEGLAEYYSTFGVEGERVRVGRPVERHLKWLRRHGDFGLDEVLEIDPRSRSYHEGDDAGRFYAVSWALVHYLLSGDAERLDRMADFLVRLEEGDEPDEAFEGAFGRRVSALEDTLQQYVLRGDFAAASVPLGRFAVPAAVAAAVLPPADALSYLGDLALALGRPSFAGAHFQRALELEPLHPEAHAGLARIRDGEGSFGEAELLFGRAAGSRDPRTWFHYGRHLLARLGVGSGAESATEPSAVAALAAAGLWHRVPAEQRDLAERARRAFDRAVGIEPDYAEALALLGTAHLVAEADPEPGLRSLSRARYLLPDRDDIVFRLAQLTARAGRIEPARRLVEGALAGRADPELVIRSREEVERAALLHAAREALEDDDIDSGLRSFDQAVAVTGDAVLRRILAEELLRLQEELGK